MGEKNKISGYRTRTKSVVVQQKEDKGFHLKKQKMNGLKTKTTKTRRLVAGYKEGKRFH